MVNTCWLAGTLCWQPVVPVIISEGKLAGDQIELRRECAVRTAKVSVICKMDWIEAETCEWRALVLPERRDGLNGIIESDPKGVVSGFDEALAGIPVDADGRLTRTMRSRSR
jgi:hypothetical protein